MLLIHDLIMYHALDFNLFYFKNDIVWMLFEIYIIKNKDTIMFLLCLLQKSCNMYFYDSSSNITAILWPDIHRSLLIQYNSLEIFSQFKLSITMTLCCFYYYRKVAVCFYNNSLNLLTITLPDLETSK